MLKMSKKEIYKILKSGSDGNAILYNNRTLLVDIGVPYKVIEPYKENIQYVFISHIHGDHFNKSTVKRLSNEKPLIKFLVGDYLKQDLLDLGIMAHQITIIKADRVYRLFKDFEIKPITLYHNVDNMGLKMKYEGLKVLHATDTFTLEHIDAINYDYYMCEANFDEEKVKEIQDRHYENGTYDYTLNSVENHHSIQDLDKWLGKNNENGKGVLVRLHQSKDNL